MLHKLTEETPKTSFVLIMREAEYPKLSEPLKDRTQGGKYRFQLPDVAEAATGLMGVGRIVGIELLDEAAVWIAQSLSGLPRGCLASLNRLRGVDGSIDLKTAQEVLADIASGNDDE